MATVPEQLIDLVLDLPSAQMWTDYDAEADVLTISFRYRWHHPIGQNDLKRRGRECFGAFESF